MKTIEINVYKFEELSPEAQEKAVNNLYDINVDFNWWQFVYGDATEIGLKIKGFDIDRGNYCEGDFLYNGDDVANRIVMYHGEQTDTRKTALIYLSEVERAKKDFPGEENENELNGILEDLESEFLTSLLEDYLTILKNEYEYQTSEEAIIETIKANDYDFTEDGKLY